MDKRSSYFCYILKYINNEVSNKTLPYLTFCKLQSYKIQHGGLYVFLFLVLLLVHDHVSYVSIISLYYDFDRNRIQSPEIRSASVKCS